MEQKGKSSRPGERPWQLMQDVRSELRKVIWPTGRQTASYTGFVVIAVIVVALITVVFDAIFGAAFSAIIP